MDLRDVASERPAATSCGAQPKEQQAASAEGRGHASKDTPGVWPGFLSVSPVPLGGSREVTGWLSLRIHAAWHETAAKLISLEAE